MSRNRKTGWTKQRINGKKGKILCGGNDIGRYDESVCITRQERTPDNCRGCMKFKGRRHGCTAR